MPSAFRRLLVPFRRPHLLATLLLVVSLAATAAAQTSGVAVINDSTAQRHGLARGWMGHLDVDRSRDRLMNLVLDLPEGVDTQAPAEDSDKGAESDRKAEKLAEGQAATGQEKQEKPRKLPSILIAQTERGRIHVFDAETGQTLWTAQVGERYRPSLAPMANDKYVAVLNGSTMFILDRATGHPVWEKELKRAPGESGAANQGHIFIPSVSGHMIVYDLKRPKRPPFNFQSFGNIDSAPTATLQSVAWATSRGFLYLAAPDMSKVRFRFQTNDAVTAPLGYWPPYVLVASRDGFVYALDEITGETPWRYSTGEPINHMPVALEGHVYAIPQLGGMYSLSAENGIEEWWTPKVQEFVAASPSRLYVCDRLGRMMILDPATGGQVDTLPTENFTLKLLNTQTDRIYLATAGGFIQSFHEPELDQPYVHRLPELISEKPKGEKPAKEESEGSEGDDESAFGGDDEGGDGEAGGDEEMKEEDADGEAADDEGDAEKAEGDEADGDAEKADTEKADADAEEKDADAEKKEAGAES